MMKKKKEKEIKEEKDTCCCNDGCNCEEECNCHDECHCDECDCGDNCSCDDACECSNEVEELLNKIKELENKVLLGQAELINYRKRKDDEVSNMLKFANQDLIMEIIPVLDNFERAIKLDDSNLDDSLSKFLEGFKMIYSHLTEVLKKFGVEEIPALGLPFDANCHEALMMGNDPEKENDIVLDVLMKGYRLKGRVIRASKVIVNKID